MTVGVAVMIFSFRQTVAAWIDQTLIADLFIAPASNEIAGPTSLFRLMRFAFWKMIPALKRSIRFAKSSCHIAEALAELGIIRGSNRRNLRFLHGRNDAIMQHFYRDQCVLVSESFARRFHLHEGDTLDLPTPAGAKPFPVAAIFYDYTRDQGIVFLSAANFIRFWNDARVNSLAIYLKKTRRRTWYPDASNRNSASRANSQSIQMVCSDHASSKFLTRRSQSPTSCEPSL